MASQHDPRTGSARSVGPQLAVKTYTFANGKQIKARSATNAIQQAAHITGDKSWLSVDKASLTVQPASAFDSQHALTPGTAPGTGGGNTGGGGTGTTLPPPTPGANKNAAAPGNVFAAEPTVTAQNDINAAKLAGLGFVADPATAWATGEKISLLPNAGDTSQNLHNFHWDGSQWVDGAA